MKQVFRESPSLERALTILEQALARHAVGPMPAESIGVRSALGRITAAPVHARYSSPFYHSAAMDGYAVRFAETAGASETAPLRLSLGSQAVHVDTGDPLPEGCNAVVMIEDVNRGDDWIEIYAAVPPYQHVRIIGEDIVATELIVPENHRLRAVDMGAMIASGHINVAVRRKPLVTIIPTGTELVAPEAVAERPPVPPEIIEYNSTLLSALAEERGAAALRVPALKDDPATIREALRKAATISDIVIINAGSGKGSEDFTAGIIGELGEVLIHSVAIKPGKPVIFGFIGNTPVFGIPGYPVSAYITFLLFVEPVIRRLLGEGPAVPDSVKAMLSRRLSSSLGVDEFVRVKVGAVGDKIIATPVGRGAGLLMSVVRADGIMKVSAASEGLEAGTEVEVSLLREEAEIMNTIVCIGSHDNSLDVLANSIKKNYPRFSLSSAHVGSMGGLIAIKRGEAHIAGTHLLDEATGDYNVSFLKRLLPDKRIVLVNLVYRQQGFLVQKGNPKAIKGFGDLVRPDVIYINRQAGAGTRLLLDKYLKDLGIDPRQVKGYEREEYTHLSVASAVLTGLADTGLAVYSSAQALGLDYIPVAEERYDLAVPAEFMGLEMIRALLRIIREDSEFRDAVVAQGGYDIRDMGKVMFEG